MSEDPLLPDPTRRLNILKIRDDPTPIALERVPKVGEPGRPRFVLAEQSTSTWLSANEEVGPEKLRPRIEPWLTALCQSEHLSLLLGSGLPNAVHLLATGQTAAGMERVDLSEFDSLVDAEAARSAKAAGRKTPNFEDQIRASNELLRGYEILGLADEDARRNAKALRDALARAIEEFATKIILSERGLIEASAESRERAFNYLVSFLMSFASRTGTRDRLNVFTINYDRFIEAGAEVAGLHLLDRFVGSLAPIFRSSRLELDMHYNPPGIRGEPRYVEGLVRFTKLHGSVDWMDCDRRIRRIGLPFGVHNLSPYLDAHGVEDPAALRLMIYPNAAKDRETAAYPYVELFRDFAAATCRPNHTLIAFGYGFGDEHINRVIEDMLTIPSTHLVVLTYDDPLERIMELYERMGRHAQVTLLIGDHVGEFRALVDHYLPKPAIDRTTFRMADLLKARWAAGNTGGVQGAGSESDEEDLDQ